MAAISTETVRLAEWRPLVSDRAHSEGAKGVMRNIRLRHYRREDLQGCLAVFDTNVPLFFRQHERDEYQSFMQALPGPYFVLENKKGEVVGCGGYAVVAEDERADLCWGMIRADVQRGGLGRLLTEARLRHAAADPRIKAVAINTSQHTVGFYERLGFRTVEVIADGYAPGLDRCEMLRDVV